MLYFSLILLSVLRLGTLDMRVEDKLLFEMNDGGRLYPDQSNYLIGNLNVGLRMDDFSLWLKNYSYIGIPQDTLGFLYNSSNKSSTELYAGLVKDRYSLSTSLIDNDMSTRKRRSDNARFTLSVEPFRNLVLLGNEEWLGQDVSEMKYKDSSSNWNQVSPEIRFFYPNRNTYLYSRFEYQYYRLRQPDQPDSTEELQRLRLGSIVQILKGSRIEAFIEEGDYITADDNRLWGGGNVSYFPSVLPYASSIKFLQYLRPELESIVYMGGRHAKLSVIASRSEAGLRFYLRKPLITHSAIYIKPLYGYSFHHNERMWERKWVGLQGFIGITTRLFLDIKEKHYWYNNREALDRIDTSMYYRFHKTTGFMIGYTHYRSIGSAVEQQRGQMYLGINQGIDYRF